MFISDNLFNIRVFTCVALAKSRSSITYVALAKRMSSSGSTLSVKKQFIP